jgi:hypothetical protein
MKADSIERMKADSSVDDWRIVMNTQSKAPNAPETDKQVDRKSSIVDAIFDVAEGWAVYGLNVAKLALEQSAKTLEKTSKAIDDVKTSIEHKAAS